MLFTARTSALAGREVKRAADDASTVGMSPFAFLACILAPRTTDDAVVFLIEGVCALAVLPIGILPRACGVMKPTLSEIAPRNRSVITTQAL